MSSFFRTSSRKSSTPAAGYSRLANLELRARSVVDGVLQGMHRSHMLGYSAEFVSHREYVPGDDLRHVNWKLYARQQRLYVKEFDAETNMSMYIYLDMSNSMECASSGVSKLECGATVAAALTQLALRQRDAVGITLYADQVLGHLDPASKPDRMQDIVHLIESTQVRPASNARRALLPALQLANRRGVVVIISDFFDDVEAIISVLDQLRFRRHEVILFHFLDPLERDLPTDGTVRFRDLETGEEVVARTAGIREEYLRAVSQWRAELQEECAVRGVDRVEIVTTESLEQALVNYLIKRMKA